MYTRHYTGKNGEEIARDYLKAKGFKIIECNFFCNLGEIDIIAKDKEDLVFIEVKTRTNNIFGRPSDAITDIKKKHMYKTAQYYLMIHKLEKAYVRFDVIEVFIYEDNRHSVNHIIAAFL